MKTKLEEIRDSLDKYIQEELKKSPPDRDWEVFSFEDDLYEIIESYVINRSVGQLDILVGHYTNEKGAELALPKYVEDIPLNERNHTLISKVFNKFNSLKKAHFKNAENKGIVKKIGTNEFRKVSYEYEITKTEWSK